MTNDTRSYIYPAFVALSCYLRVLVVALAIIISKQANADVPPYTPPPVVAHSSGFPSEMALKRQGYDVKTGTLRIDNAGAAKVSSSGGKTTGTQAKTVTYKGRYGEKVKVNTKVTQTVSNVRLSASAGALPLIGSLGASLREYGPELGSRLGSGDYLGAGETALKTIKQTADDFFGGVGSALMDSFHAFQSASNGQTAQQQAETLEQQAAKAEQAQAQAEQQGDFAGAVANAAVAKSAHTLANAAKEVPTPDSFKPKNDNGVVKYPFLINVVETAQPCDGCDWAESSSWYMGYSSSRIGHLSYGWFSIRDNNIDDFYNIDDFKFNYTFKYTDEKYRNTARFIINTYPATQENAKRMGSVNNQDLILNSNDVKVILQRMLENQQTNHKELMEQLSNLKNSDGTSIVDSATESTSVQPVSVLSEPYTPSGSTVAQQTKVSVDSQGNVTTEIIQRPDLTANSSQAPTRQEIGTNVTTNSAGGQPNPEQQRTLCDVNPNAAACSELGNTDYEDIDIPEQQINVVFSPIDYFSVDGVCPQPRTIDLGLFGTFEFSFQPLCDFARGIRPILILITIITCAWFVNDSLKGV